MTRSTTRSAVLRSLPLSLSLLLPALAIAAPRDDYARQWPLQVASADAEAGAFRVVLDRAVYGSATQPSVSDITVLDADGNAVPVQLFAASQPVLQAARLVAVPWFALPAGKAAQARDIAVISERSDDGRVQRVETRIGAAGGDTPRAVDAWLVDASQLLPGAASPGIAQDAAAPMRALQLEWDAASGPVDARYAVEGSDDLRSWRTLQPQAQLLDLVRGGQRLRQARIALDGSARYLRLLPLGGHAPLLTGVQVELAPLPTPAQWQWQALPGTAVVEQGTTHYTFALDARLPVERVDVALPGNNAAQWTLQSRDGDDAPWTQRAGPWTAFQVGGAAANRSAAQPLDGIVRDRQWRLSTGTPPAGVPTLRLGWQPESLVYVAQGRAPHALVAGSARATRADAPVADLLDALRTQRGVAWQPAVATLGPPADLAGTTALQPAAVQRDWKSWLLWALLVIGALVVAGFAVSLLRKPATPAP